MNIKVPSVVWALGDPEQTTTSGVTLTRRPLYYRNPNSGGLMRVGSIDPDYAEPLMHALLAVPSPQEPKANQ